MRFYNLLRIILLLITLLIIYPTLSIAGQYKVFRIVDGDIIVIKYNGKYEKVRLLCVNTPESVHPDEQQNIPMGKVALRYTQKKLTGKYIQLEYEINRLRGNDGFLLAYVFVDGENLNLDLIRKGFSPYCTKYGKSQKYDFEFRAAEKLARKENLNIWGDPELTKKYLKLKSKWGQNGKENETRDSQN
jgi:micrococcal nuclease